MGGKGCSRHDRGSPGPAAGHTSTRPTCSAACWEGLEYRHRTYRQTFGPAMGPDTGLFVEVCDLMEMAGPREPTPASLLATSNFT